ncbi:MULTISPECIES: S1 RNA-binding domain-containing protein [Ruminococcus]|uniref:S1 RNA binding domain protein n=1 Tax=Ruminococcus flavefaciens TaxID=1265 RepID=A0A1M7JT63_RUMFL|nr:MULTISPECIES: S1 RNA-binding domain-containing protein [Ruminococcus]MCR4796305.1 S1 RNA-binding domain-containing protein [Ruminococcus sp.]SHM56178.1 S1 RNA binding domain protein [Ruminococcus flavefaciens]
MQLEIGKIYNGKVKGITQYGAFVDIEGGGTGMVHISEIANTYVSDIREHLTEDQDVKVKVIGINEAGKVSLSIKKASENGDSQQRQRRFDKGQGKFDKGDRGADRGERSFDKGDKGERSFDKGERGGERPQRSKPVVWEPKKQIPPSEMTFEDMMSRFKQTSEERMCDLKRSTDRKNGTRRK